LDTLKKEVEVVISPNPDSKTVKRIVEEFEGI
jgi:hypothetical protein